MSSLFRILKKVDGNIKEIYDERNISGEVYMAVLDYIDECGIVFDFLQNFNGNTDSYALEVFPEEAQEVLDLFEKNDFGTNELIEEWGYDSDDILYGIRVIKEYFEKLISQQDKSSLIFEIY